MPMGAVQSLRQLAQLYGVQTAYYDVTHRRVQASPESLLLALQALGAPIESLEDVPSAYRGRREAIQKRCVEPVVVAWDGEPPALNVRVPGDWLAASLACTLVSETGEIRRWTCKVDQLPTSQAIVVGEIPYITKRLSVPGLLPWGYHRLTLEAQRRILEAMIISAPRKAYSPREGSPHRLWGVFLPLYALHSERSWGGGDFGDLEALVEWVAGLGGRRVATLPLLAAFLEETYEVSPYAPASRLFWNEFYIDVTRIPELTACRAAQALLESGDVQNELETLRSAPLVDYRRQMALKRKVLEELVRYLFTEATERYAAFHRFVQAHPQVEDYARFRAAGERQHAPWPKWPQPLRDGVLHEGDYDEEAKRYHLYVQWIAHEQMTILSEKTKATGAGLYLDLPLGVHPYSYDVWREREMFARDASGGAPPDVVFTKGQNWGFPPLHPENIRTQGYRHYIDYLRHQLQHTSLLRIDHVMALHRLFWIPRGLEPHQGVYVRYPAEELYAILSLESHRHRAGIVGENLGTVPGYVNSTMVRRNVQQMYVVQYELNPGSRRVLRPVPRDCVANLNTHDMPPFAAYWQCLDIDERRAMGLLDSTGARIERKNRRALQHALHSFLERKGCLKANAASVRALLEACLVYLSAGPARVILTNLEDLWLEREPQNVPGTVEQHPNWRRKARYRLDHFCHVPQVVETLQEIDRRRSPTGRTRNQKHKGETGS